MMMELHWFLMSGAGRLTALLALLIGIVGYVGCIIFETKWGGFDD